MLTILMLTSFKIGDRLTDHSVTNKGGRRAPALKPITWLLVLRGNCLECMKWSGSELVIKLVH